MNLVWLYIKQHRITKLKYFGKKTSLLEEEVIKYNGSGKYWLRHLAIYGADVDTLWCRSFDNTDELVEFAEFFSEEADIVNAKGVDGKKIWANLRNENGLDGMPKGTKSPSTSLTNSRTKKGVPSPLRGKKTNKPNLGVSESNRKRKGKSSGRLGISTFLKGTKQPTVKCTHCGKEGGVSNMKRYHFNNCKQRPRNETKYYNIFT